MAWMRVWVSAPCGAEVIADCSGEVALLAWLCLWAWGRLNETIARVCVGKVRCAVPVGSTVEGSSVAWAWGWGGAVLSITFIIFSLASLHNSMY